MSMLSFFLTFDGAEKANSADERTALATAAAASHELHHSKRNSSRPYRHDHQASKPDQQKANNRRETADGRAAASRAA